MKNLILKTLFISFFIGTSHAAAAPLVNSHLRVWDSSLVERHLKLGADIIEIDIANLEEPELQKSLLLLARYPGKLIALHLKGIGEEGIPQIEGLLERNQSIWSQLWFFSGNSNVDAKIRSKFPIGYVSRSTKQNVISCLGSGLDDELAFLANCIEKDLWIRPVMMNNQSDKDRMKRLVMKIRNYEKDHLLAPSLIALDQIDSLEIYCKFVPDFAPLVDGVVTENFEAILPAQNGQHNCP